MDIKAIERINSVQLVANQLREMILDGDLKPNEKLDYEELAAAFSVSRMPLREAIRILESEDLVHTIPRGGTLVTEMSEAQARELTQIRQLLEGYAARLAAGHPEQAASLLPLYQQMDQTQDSTEYYQLHREFHFSIYRLAQMPLLLKFIEIVWNQGERYRRAALHVQAHTLNQEHLELAKAVSSGDGPRAEALIHEHLEQSLLAFLQPEKGHLSEENLWFHKEERSK
jgi:DNA-binding GntR family transcriptional regulator